jgi:hypothetical protein
VSRELTIAIMYPMFNVTTFYIRELHQRSDSVRGSVDGEEIEIVHIIEGLGLTLIT